MGINIGLFVSNDRTQKLFDQEELQIKMSSLLNVYDDASRKPKKFILKDIEVFVESEE